MREFKVLPTDERFLNLTDDQIYWILTQMKVDIKESERRAKGYSESYYDPTFDEWAEEFEAGQTDELFKDDDEDDVDPIGEW